MSLTELKENLKKISFVRWIIIIFILIDCHENKFNILSNESRCRKRIFYSYFHSSNLR